MNITIVTWMGTGNFGTSLQSYALHEFLKQQGFDVCLLKEFSQADFILKNRLLGPIRHIVGSIKRFIKGIICKTNIGKIQKFNKKNYNVVSIHSDRELQHIISTTDVFVTGSDQIWNCYHSYSPFMFLSFVDSVKKISYASSIGTKDFPTFCKYDVKNHLSRFSHIAVREKSSVEYLIHFLGRDDIVQVLDPTFLLRATHWKKFAEKSKFEFSLPTKFIFCYLIGNNSKYEIQLDEIKQKTGIMNVIIVPSLENKDMNFPHCHIYKQAGPYEFVSLIDKAALICTDSFHACALSINMSKDFVVLKRFEDDDPKSQNSRIYDLLNSYGLQSNIYSSDWIFVDSNFNNIQSKLEIDRRDSINYLNNAIYSL
ncbi:MAG: polysaccharide pyruvyl transferase family protein [Prevotella sp.]|nr:polysaccharide pyruvyl transferase family protein [Prevotella sp.]